MRKDAASVLALAALSLAEELTVNDVPLACANICGPVVELSALCDTDGSTRPLELRRRRLARGLAREDAAQDPRAKGKRQLFLPETVTIDQPRNGVIGEFKTITNGVTPTGTPPFNRAPSTAQPVIIPPVQQPAQPANPNGELVGQVPEQPAVTQTFNLRPTTTPTFINPLFPSLVPPQTQPAPPVVETPPQAVQPPATTTILPISSSLPGGGINLPVGNGGGAVSPSRGVVGGGGTADAGEGDGGDERGDVTDNVGDIRDDAGALWPGQKQHDQADREIRCFCTNNSFEVARVAALCASCISQVGDENTPMKGIMSQCNFTAEEYEPAKDRVVANVRVRATSGAARSLAPTTAGLAVTGVVIGLVGLAEMLL